MCISAYRTIPKSVHDIDSPPLSGGNLVHLGRMDHQVKSRGHRVEVGEVEVAMLKHPAIREAAVAGKGGETGGSPLLYGYAVSAPGSEAVEANMQALLRDRLPAFMVPARIVFLAGLPLTPGGKVGRKALPFPEGRSEQYGR